MWPPLLKETLLRAASNHGQKQATLEEKVNFLMAYERKKCAALLFFGAIFGFLGFAFAFIIGFMKFLRPAESEFHEKFPSGYGYFPSTVSEMVHNPQEPAGKCFFAFEFVGAFFIFMSWYPWELRNVYIGDTFSMPFLSISWSMFRQFIPPAGMMLVATVTTTPFAQATELDAFCIGIHLTGAVMLFAGYAVVEAHTIGFLVKQHESTERAMGKKERRLRKFCLTGIIACYAAFCTIQGIVLLPLEKYGGKNDVWEERRFTLPTGHHMAQMVLIDTASGFVLALKIASYACEVFCGLFLIASFLTIWYFCEERHSDLKDELFSVADTHVSVPA